MVGGVRWACIRRMMRGTPASSASAFRESVRRKDTCNAPRRHRLTASLICGAHKSSTFRDVTPRPTMSSTAVSNIWRAAYVFEAIITASQHARRIAQRSTVLAAQFGLVADLARINDGIPAIAAPGSIETHAGYIVALEGAVPKAERLATPACHASKIRAIANLGQLANSITTTTAVRNIEISAIIIARQLSIIEDTSHRLTCSSIKII